MSKQTVNSSNAVLRAKFRAAHALVDFYEKRIHELRMFAQMAVVNREPPSEQRERILKVIKAILDMPFSGSLLIRDHARAVKADGKRFQRRLAEAYTHWQRCNEAILDLDRKPGSPVSEMLALAAFSLATCEVLTVGVAPVRKLRDGYAEQLESRSRERFQKQKGRCADPSKPDRDSRIYVEFMEMQGKVGEKQRELGRKYGLSRESIRKIVRQQKQHLEKLGMKRGK